MSSGAVSIEQPVVPAPDDGARTGSAASSSWRSGSHAHAGLPVPVPADRRRRRVQLQRHEPERDRLAGLQPQVVRVAPSPTRTSRRPSATARRSASSTRSSRPRSGRWRRSASSGSGKRLRLAFDALTYVSVIIPEIVIALASLVLFAIVRDLVNPVLASLHVRRRHPVQIQLGQWSVVAAHVLFNMSLVLLLVRARLSGMDRTCRGQLRPVRDAVADVPPDHVSAAAAGDRGGVPAVVHVQLRRLRHHVVRVAAPARRPCRSTSSARPARA